MKLIIEDDEGRKTVVPFVREEITIGRQEGNTIRLTERNVSRKHARLLRQNGHVLVEDLGSHNGIRLNGEKIDGQVAVRDGDLIQIGDYDLAIQNDQAAHPPPPPALKLADEEEATSTAVQAPNGLAAAGLDADELHRQSDRESLESDETTPEPPEPTAPSAQAAEAARRQVTSVIRVDQIESQRPIRQRVDLSAEHAPRLMVLNTPLQGREFACIRTELRIGRTSDNDIGIDHRSLSRTHAKLVREDNGDWRILDLESANGLTVNGERYAEATLSSGDIIELGHVQLKFLYPGDSFEPSTATSTSMARKGRWMGLALGGALVLAAGLSAFRLWPRVHPAPAAQLLPTAPPLPTAPDPTTRLASAVPAVQVAKPDEKIRGAKTAIEGLEFEKAIDILESIHNPDGTRPARVEEMLSQAHREVAARRALGLAQKELGAGHPDQAATFLAQAQGTVAYASDFAKVKAGVDSALRTAPKAVAVKEPPSRPAALASSSSPVEEAHKYLDDGTSLFKKKQFKEAKLLFTKCVELDRANARCHKMLGSTFASLRDVEQGAKHYRMFVKLAPDDPDAPKVRQLLEEYDAHR